jgi:hypothetical protein
MPRINEDTHRFWDLVIKALASVAFIGPLVFGYFQSLRTADLEARKPYLQKQLDLCVEAANAAGTIATAPDYPATVAAARATFNRLYWGALAMFDNAALSKAMLAFSDAVAEGASPERLRPLAEAVAHRCKDLTRAEWGVR